MRISRPLLGGFDSGGGKTAFLTGPFYYYSLGLLAILAFLAWRAVHSPLGLEMRAVRDNPQKAAYLGVEVQRTRLWAFVISAVYCSIAGVLIGVSVGLADPELGYWTQSGNLVFMTLLGGSGAFGGPVLLLLDEPFEGLSPAIIPEIAAGIGFIRSMGCSILLAESNIHHVPEAVDRVYVLERGEIIFSGQLHEAREDRFVNSVIFGGE